MSKALPICVGAMLEREDQRKLIPEFLVNGKDHPELGLAIGYQLHS